MQRTERDLTAGKIPVQLACFLRWGVTVGSALIGSGAHVTVVALVDNACEFVKHL